MSTEQKIRSFITDNFFVDADELSLPADASLTQGGTIDSMGVLELIMFIENQWSIQIPDSDTVPENLDSIERIVNYVQARSLVQAGT